MRKALVAALVLTFVLSIAATASAAVLTPASFPDVKGQACADAVAKLEALGVGKGIDGQWMPELPVNRAQFATFAVRIMGLERVAAYLKGATKFADVPADHWASGYINVAVAKKLVLGYPDGTFHPDETITFAQAATMLGRVVGYVDLPGDWPANYMIVASEKNLFSGVTFGAGDVVNRGDMAILLANALGATKVKPSADFPGVYDETSTALMKASFNLDLPATAILNANADVDASLTGQEVLLGSTKYTMPAGVNTAALLGHEVKFIADTTSYKVLYAEDVTAASNIVTGTLNGDAASTSFKIGDISYNLGAATVFVNKAKVSGDVYLALKNGMDVTAFLGADGTVRFVVGFAYDVSDAKVAAVDTTNKTITVGGTAYAVKANTTITKNGSPATLSDVQAGQIIYIACARGANGAVTTDALYVAVFDKTVSGTVTGVRVASDATYVKLGGTDYKVSAKAEGTLDGTNLDTNGNAGLQVDELSKLFSFAVTATLNKDGALRILAGSTVGTVGLYADKETTADGKTLVKVDVKGNIVKIEDARTSPTYPTLVGTPVLAKTNASGKLTDLETLVLVPGGASNITVDAVSSAARQLTAAGNVLSVSADAFFKKGTSYVALDGVKVGDKVSLYAETSAGAVLYGELFPVVVVAGNAYGKYLGYSVDESGAVTAYVDVKGSTVSYEVYLNQAPAVSVGDFVYGEVRSDGKIQNVGKFTVPDYDDAEILAINDDGSLTITGGVVISLANASLYDTDAAGKVAIQASALKVGDKVDVYKGTGADASKYVVVQRVALAP
ncbi:MAG: S-layer homology domain-containing protein [Bacillota bacterium]|nr:S-layer homology domain-containing protein [Bacillota bacterium]